VRVCAIICFLLTLAVFPANAARLADLCEIQGAARENDLQGIGIVVGLAGTGDKAPAAILAQERMLSRLGIDVTSANELRSDNVAIVAVTAKLPAFAKQGTRIDVHVSSLYDSKSLEGGTLLETYLNGQDEQVYAIAQGSLSVGGFNAGGGGGTSVRKNHVTAGRIPMGAYVEREVPSTITDGERINLLLKRPDFTTANNIQEALNSLLGAGMASALGAGTINIIVPTDEQSDLVAFIARVLAVDVAAGYPSKVVINERTGTIVVGGSVMVKPCQVAHGNLTIRITATPLVSQPPPFSDTGATVVTEVQDVEPVEELAYLMPVEGTSAADVADALNQLKVTPRDMISIFQALREAGALEADLEIM
jgi:flagellar P-ring protein precursor FlgI